MTADAREESDGKEGSGEGLVLGLLVLVALLLCGNLWAVLHLRQAVSSSGPQAGPGAVARESPQAVDEYEVLLLHDLVLGIVRMQAAAPPAVRLTREQKQQLLALEPQIQRRLTTGPRQPGPLDARVRALLTQEQKASILEGFRKSTTVPPVHMAPHLTRFRELLSD